MNNILVTGGNGFLGAVICKKLKQNGIEYFAPRSHAYDLTNEQQIKALFKYYRPSIVIHLAAVVGGIGANQASPGTFYYKNLMMGAMLMEHARLNNVSKFVSIGTVCSYPKHTPTPFKEEDLWSGYPEETNAPYGIAKKTMIVQSKAYKQEFGFNGINLLPANLYGPNDNFDPKTSHVIPAIIKKCIDAKNNGTDIVCWGTGSATREFLYVEDAADAIILATEHHNDPEPINIGSGNEISIKNLTEIIAKLTKYEGKITWDYSKPDGQPRRVLDTSKAKKIGFTAQTSLNEGLQRTIDWYVNRSISR